MLEIIDLPVKNDANRAVLIEHGLFAARQIHDRQTTVSQTNSLTIVKTFAIGTTMRDDTRHPLQQRPIHPAAPLLIENSSYAAHFLCTRHHILSEIAQLRIKPLHNVF